MGFAFDVKAKNLPGTPDLVDQTLKWAIFVHGCFWHAHTCPLWKIPKTNPEFWEQKFSDNKKRDRKKSAALRKRGYSVLTLWQCELKDHDKTRKKLLRFLPKPNGNYSGNGHPLQIPESQPQSTSGGPETYKYLKGIKQVSRSVVKTNGTEFVSRLRVPAGVSLRQDARSIFDQAFLRSPDGPSYKPPRGPVRAVDLFCGCGGLSLGAREASSATGRRFQCLLAVEHDQASLQVFEDNFAPSWSYDSDISQLLDGCVGQRLQRSEKELVHLLSPVDLLLAGPPCQGHSALNNHTRGRDGRNKLYEKVARFVEITGPEHILVENVPAVIHGHGRALDKTAEQLVSFGYKVDAGIVDLAELGVAQRRKRHVLIASHSRYISIADVVKKHRVEKKRSVRWAIADIGNRTTYEIFDAPSILSQVNVNRIDYLFKHGLYNLPDGQRPICHQTEHSYKSMYGRLRYNELAQTITSGFGSPGQGRFIHPTRRRTLTPHEAARLQFFPDSFDFSSVRLRASLANMIGNAAPMKLSYVFTLEFMS
jgi:DNA (cytosine-5)-methyltransferase 1